jgi:hypothetical protein
MKSIIFLCSNLVLAGLIFLCMRPGVCIAQNQALEKAETGTRPTIPVWRQIPATPEELNRKIEEAAQQAKDGDSFPFSVIYNIAYPEDSSAYEALNGHAILMLTAISHKQEELPLKSVYVQQDTARIELKLIRMILSDQSQSGNLNAKVFGAYRMDAVYILPIPLRVKAGTLLADFAQNHSGVKVAVFGAGLSNELAELVSHPPKSQTTPPLSTLEAFIEEEFPTLSEGILLDFSTKFTRCVNHWVAFPRKPTQNDYSYGFIYLDEQAGLTFQMAGKFRIENSNRFVKISNEEFDKKYNIKVRIEGNRFAAILPSEAITRLGLPERPDWLKYYDDGKNSPYHRMRLGFWLNELGDNQQALTLLESAYKDQPTTEGLGLELAYAYNALRQFDKSIPVLSAALKSKPKDVLLGNELAYANLHKGNYKEAIELYLQFIPLCPDSRMVQKSEMALNLAQAYRHAGADQEQQKWMEKAKAWAPEGSAVSNYFKQQR